MADEESGKCHKHLSPEAPPSFFQNGDAVFQAHHVGWIVCGVFTIIATVASFWLINKHLQWYTNKREQRYIVRLLFLVPIYAIVSFASFLFWNNSTPLILVRDAYEAIVLTAFFYLLLNYLSPDPEEQRWIFLKFGISQENDAARRSRGEKPQKWMWPMGFIKSKPKDGLYFLQLMKWGVLQYCVIRPITTLIAVIMDYMGYYCEASWAPKWGHLWIVLIISISVTIAMYCLIQIYMPVTKQLESHRPLLKLFAVKAVVFLTFWQATFLGLLSLFGVVKNGKYMTAEDINIGIGALLQCFEMMIFAFLHIKAFTYKPYRPFYNPESKEPPPSKTPRLRSLGNVLDFRETFREIWVGCVYLWDKMRGKEPSPDFGVRRAAHYEGAFGRPRPTNYIRPSPNAKSKRKKEQNTKSPELPPITVEREVEIDVGGERQWLGNGDDYGYGLGYFRRERSEAFGVQIEKELQKRGYSNDTIQASQSNSSHTPERSQAAPVTRKQRQGSSWWRALYDRFSSTGHESDDNHDNFTPSSPRRLQSRHRSQQPSDSHRGLMHDSDHDLSDPPPTSAFRASAPIIPEPRYSPILGKEYYNGGGGDNDGLGPLSLYRERRRSSRPKRQRDDSSSALLLPPSPPPAVQRDANWRSDREPGFDDDASAMDIRQGGAGGPSQELLAIPTGHNNRSDSLLHRLFPPSEAGSLNDQTRETDSAYSLSVDDHHVRHQLGSHLPSHSLSSNRAAERIRQQQDPASKPLPVLTGDKRLQVHEQMVHPSKSATAILAPWTADVVGLRSQSTFEQPPTPPAKDSQYPKSYGSPVSQQEQRGGRSHIRESAYHHPQDGLDRGQSYSRPERAQYGGQGVSGVPASPSSATSFSSRSELSYPPSFGGPPEPVSPPASHVRETRNRKPAPEWIPNPILAPAARSGPSRKTLRPSPDAVPSSSSRGRHDAAPTSVSLAPAPRKERKPQRHQLHTPPAPRARSADSDNDSDASGNTFYTAASYPPESTQVPPVPRR